MKGILKGPEKQEDEWGADGDGENDEMDGHGGRGGQKRGRR